MGSRRGYREGKGLGVIVGRGKGKRWRRGKDRDVRVRKSWGNGRLWGSRDGEVSGRGRTRIR